ncbi:hypothetical protein F7Q99_25580 [Streptomyces kaniharaensis]|uniref:DUF2867 domain-containing protein n=1 Tax=Streptomyces kaniharaensis TaxID=212423 RepID=A0A6N7KVK7_9ACTN|nr:hypothetical protein [Streptomyces kaniharaensis]MQS15550.1 hypothetical protein [Streptomyces kaniharaensis]
MTGPLDRLIPDPQFTLVHERHIPRSPDTVWQALETLRFSDLPLVRGLLGARMASSRGPHETADNHATLREHMTQRGYTILANEPPHLDAVGAVTRYWQFRVPPPEPLTSAEEFTAFDRPGYAKALSAFILSEADGGTLLRCETRISATDQASRRRFAAYWWGIRLGSSLIRQMILTAVARKAVQL